MPELFGDERADYGEALQKHYGKGLRPIGTQQFVSAYASMHPWEDWAETWAHYLHMTDTLETAAAAGLSLQPDHPDEPAMDRQPVKPASQQEFARDHRQLVPAHLRPEQPQPRHGPVRRLPLRAPPARHRQAPLRSRDHLREPLRGQFSGSCDRGTAWDFFGLSSAER